MTAWFSEVLKISVRTFVSCSAQSFSMRPGMLSGPAALRGLILDRVFLTSAGDRQSAWSLGGVEFFLQGCHSAFQTMNNSCRVHLGMRCRHHRPVTGACSQLRSEWLATGSMCLCCL